MADLKRKINIDDALNLADELGNKKKYELAEKLYLKIINYDKFNIRATNNLANIYKNQGKTDLAFKYYNNALKIDPDNSNIFINIGSTYDFLMNNEEAVKFYKKALKKDSKNSHAYFNLHSHSKNINIAIKQLENCLNVNRHYERAIIMLSALKKINGDEKLYSEIKIKYPHYNHYFTSYDWYFSLKNRPKLIFNRRDFFDKIINLSNKNNSFYEFGVFTGVSFNYINKHYDNGYGFDTFTGLPEDWGAEKKGAYSSENKMPKSKKGKFIKGEFKDTLPDFFSKSRPMASVINFDADLYSSTICALNNCMKVINRSTLLIFDEFIMNKNWQDDEFRALTEFCIRNNFQYEVVAVSFSSKQVALKIKNI